MQRVSIDARVRERFAELRGLLNERERRVWAAVEAKAPGYGGIAAVARATGISRRAIHVGLRELRDRRLAVRRSESDALAVDANRW